MKKLILLSLLLMSVHASASETKSVLCLESGQETAFITADYFKVKDVYTVNIKGININGTVASEETLTGSDPDLNVINATDANGEKIVIIQSVVETDAGAQMRVLLCTE